MGITSNRETKNLFPLRNNRKQVQEIYHKISNHLIRKTFTNWPSVVHENKSNNLFLNFAKKKNSNSNCPTIDTDESTIKKTGTEIHTHEKKRGKRLPFPEFGKNIYRLCDQLCVFFNIFDRLFMIWTVWIVCLVVVNHAQARFVCVIEKHRNR